LNKKNTGEKAANKINGKNTKKEREARKDKLSIYIEVK